MESLAVLVTILLLVALLGGPIAIGMTMIKTESIHSTTIRRVLHGLFVTTSLWVGLMFLFSGQLPITPRLIGLYTLIMSYIATRREYFPDVRIIAPLLAKFGIKIGKKQKQSGNEPGSSHFGPVMKWRRNGRFGRNDGHGPEGQD